ncbi:MAG: hypothetical protein KDD50_10810, partial [Bdellovibrionales bacterium]|nr:hypothetical protein [Bdellovibrionales bacterium]
MNSFWNPLHVWQLCNLGEKIISASAAMIFLTSLFILSSFDQIFPSFEVDPNNAIATATLVKLDVRRKPPQHFAFSKLFQNSFLVNNDTVFSGTGSEVQMTFFDNTRLAVGANSLIVVRLINGKIDVKLEKGTLSGTFGDEKQVDLTTKEEVVTLEGKKGETFTVFYKEGRGMGVTSTNKRVRLTKKEKEIIIDRKLKSKKPKDRELEKGTVTSNVPLPSEFGVGRGDKVISVSKEVPQFRVEENYPIPYPANDTYVLHKTGGDIMLLPYKRCQTKCNLKIYFKNALLATQYFNQGDTPVIQIELTSKTFGEIIWILIDGEEEVGGQFQVQYNSAAWI